MRKQLRYILFACTLYCGVNSYAQNVSINKNGAAPDNSAMLDVSDTAKGILVPRLTFVQRNLISNPATGLLIFQTDSDSGFYYNQGTAPLPVWVRLITSANNVTELSDADNDTKIQLDKTNDDDLIRFDTKGSEVMRIDSLGNVSIGSAPSVSYHKLSVSTDKIGGGFRLNQETDTAGSELSFFNNSLFKWSLGSMNDSNALGESFFLYNNDRGVMDLFIDGDNGNLGVGTTNPEGKLHLYGTGPLGSGARLVFGDDYQSTTNQWNSFIAEAGWDSNIDTDVLQFHARAGHSFTTGTFNGVSPDTILNISPFGRVSIGNQDLGQRLNVYAAGNAFTRIHSDSGQIGLWATNDSAGWAIFSERKDGGLLQQGSAGMFMTNGSGLAWTVTKEGKMGIGTPNTPALELSIGPVDDDTGFETNTDGVLSLFTNAIERVTFRDSMVGIGTTLPRKELDVRGSIIASSKPLTSLPTGLDYTLLTNNNGRGLLGVYNGFSSLSLDVNANDISFKTGSSNFSNPTVMFIDDLGNVGIGTTSPTELLHISKSEGDATLLIEADTDNNNEGDNPRVVFEQDGGAISGFMGFEGTGGTFSTNTISNSFLMATTSSSSIQFATNSVVNMTILNNGNVGIGTVSPEGLLTIIDAGNSNPGIYLDGFDDNEGDIAAADGQRIQFGQWNASTDAFTLNVAISTTGDLELQNELQTEATGEFNMLPIAMASFNDNGSTRTSTGNIACTRNSQGNYTVTVSGHSASMNNDIVQATIIDGGTGEISVSDGGTGFDITIRASSGLGPVDRDFSIIIYSEND